MTILINILNKRNKINLSTDTNTVNILVDRSSPLGNPFEVFTHTIDTHNKCIQLYRKYLWYIIKDKNINLHDIANVTCTKTYPVSKVWLNKKWDRQQVIEELSKIVNYVKQGKNVNLICWCTPLPCHADIISKCIDYLVTNNIEL